MHEHLCTLAGRCLAVEQFSSACKRRNSSPSLFWIVVPALLSGLIGAIAAGIYVAESETTSLNVIMTLGVGLAMALVGAVFGFVLWAFARVHPALAFSAVGVTAIAWIPFIVCDRVAIHRQSNLKNEKQGQQVVEKALPVSPVDAALGEYESMSDQIARLYSRQRQMKFDHWEKERSRKETMDLAGRAGAFELTNLLIKQAQADADETIRLSDEVGAASRG